MITVTNNKRVSITIHGNKSYESKVVLKVVLLLKQDLK